MEPPAAAVLDKRKQQKGPIGYSLGVSRQNLSAKDGEGPQDRDQGPGADPMSIPFTDGGADVILQ